MPDFTRELIKTVVTTHLLGVSHFDDGHTQSDVLGQLFCFAVRNVLEEESQGTGRSRGEILGDLAQRTRTQVLPETFEAFASLHEEEFNGLLDAVLAVADESGLTRQELAEGLSSVNEIMDTFLKSEADNSNPPG